MPTRNVNLTEHLDRFVDEKIASGRYGNASEIIREALRLLEFREQEERAKLEWLRNAASEGFDQLDRGEGIEFRSAAGFDRALEKLAQEAQAGIASERKRG